MYIHLEEMILDLGRMEFTSKIFIIDRFSSQSVWEYNLPLEPPFESESHHPITVTIFNIERGRLIGKDW